MGRVKELLPEDWAGPTYEPDLSDYIDMMARDVLTSATRLADATDFEPNLVASQCADIRAAISALEGVLTKTRRLQ